MLKEIKRSSIIKRAFFWLSGAGTETLEACPNWEQRKYVAFGATVLVPCSFAFIACAYALSTLTDRPGVIFPIAAIWACIILAIDRALLASYRPYLPITRKLGQFGLRFCVAVLMGLTIAHPLVLLLFRDTIGSVVERARQGEVQAVRERFSSDKEAVRKAIAGLEDGISAKREKWNETFLARFEVQKPKEAGSQLPGLTPQQQAELKKSITEATAPFTERLAVVQQQLAEATPQSVTVQGELTYWQAEFERELNGQRSGLAGEGPRARSIRSDQLEPRREESRRLAGLLDHLSSEKASLESRTREAEAAAIAAFDLRLLEIERTNQVEIDRVAALKQRVEQDQAEVFVTQQNALRETIKSEIDTRLKELERAQGELAAVANDERERLDAIHAEPRKDILTQTLALHSVFESGDQAGMFALSTYVVLTLLFMLVDTIPLIVKFFCKPGPYDNLLDRDEVLFDSDHRAFLASNGRYMQQLAAGNLTAVTRNKPLEHALVNGVEHTRVAREFIDSLIEMEKSFAERMRMEEQEAGYQNPEKLKALEEMKSRFYQSLHQRMAGFFGQPDIPAA
jgi:hypothetical protein